MPLYTPSIFRHTQATPLQVWTIVHNLGANGSQGIPIVDVYILDNGAMSKIIPGETTIVDKNTVALSFAEPRAGLALIIV
jgi:hypothetical protein